MNRTDRLYALVDELRAVSPRRRSARWLAARFEVSVRTVAIASTQTVAMLGGAVTPAANRSVIVEFEVADVDAELARLQPDPQDVVLPPSTMPWGNRSALLRDPDGNVVNLFSRPPA